MVAAAVGGFTAVGVNQYMSGNTSNESIQESLASVWSDSTPQAGNHFTAYQAEQYPDLTYAAENAVARMVEVSIHSTSFSVFHMVAVREDIASLKRRSRSRVVRALSFRPMVIS